jgi:hypothetical protein
VKATATVLSFVTLATVFGIGDAAAQEICQGYGPQAPRDISSRAGTNPYLFAMAPAASDMNLCNIHFHTNAEHKGPGFSIFAGDGEHGGYRCNETDTLTEAELQPLDGDGGCRGLSPGDSVEVHWVYTTCDVEPGEGLDACLSEQCTNPQLRVESQVFVAVNDDSAPDFNGYVYDGYIANGLHQAKMLPTDTGDPVEYLGSTTGPSYTEQTCSPLQVTWNVRPSCAKVSIRSLNEWCKSNVFKEDQAGGVRQLVTSEALLAPIR